MKGLWTPRRRDYWTLKIVVSCCIVLFIFSQAFSRKLPAESKQPYLGRSVLLERRVVEQRVERRSEVRGRILDEVERGKGDEMNDYSTPTHNHNGEEESPSPPASKSSVRGTMRYSQDRFSRQFARYTAQHGHRHLRGV